MGGSSGGTQIYTPTPPPAPSMSSTIQDYVSSLPALFAAQQKYAPLEAAQQVQLAQQYAVPLAEAYKSANEVLYPGTAGLQEQLAAQASQGINAQVPQSQRQQYLSDLNAQLGTNVNSGVGADYVSRNLMNQQQQYQQYYQNLGLSLAGRQPLAQAQSPGFTNQLGGVNAANALGYGQGIYSSQVGGSQPMAMQRGTPNWITGLQAGGSVLGGLGAAFCWVAAEVFDGWYTPKTIWTRIYFGVYAPKWVLKFYIKHGKEIANFIKDKEWIKNIIRPIFESLSNKAKELTYGTKRL